MAKKVLATLLAIRSNRALYDYEVEWLESNQTDHLYIDTGIIPKKATLRVAGKTQYLGSSDYLCGGIGNYSGLGNTGNNFRVQSHGIWAGLKLNFCCPIYVGTVVTYEKSCNRNSLLEYDVDVINGLTLTTDTTYKIALSSVSNEFREVSLKLFNDDPNANSWNRVYYMKIYEGNTLVRDYIPVVKDNVGYMYDKVSGQLFGNESGHGAFTWGPIAKHYKNLGMLMPYYDKHQAEEEMYKEMLNAMRAGVESFPLKPVRIYSEDITWLVPNAFSEHGWNKRGTSSNNHIYSVDFPNLSATGTGGLGNVFSNSGIISFNLPKLLEMAGTYNFNHTLATEIYLPSLTKFSNHDFSYSNTLKILRLPSVTSKTGSYFVYQDSALEHVYLPQMTLALLGGASYIAQLNCNSAAIFHLQDGDYDYQGQPITS